MSDILNRSTNEILASTERIGSHLKDDIHSSSWETRNLINSNANALTLEQSRMKEYLASQAAQNFAMTQLEQQKSKELLSIQLADSKYEALKNQQFLSAQMAQTGTEIKVLQQAATADAKYEALKNQQLLSMQLSECCCEIKQKVDQRAIDVTDTITRLDTDRLRDEVNFFRVLDRVGDRGRGRSRSPPRRRGGD
jgi:hypothetical protein